MVRLDIEFQKHLVRISTLCLTCSLAIMARLFSVVRYESIIHEFDPYFNYRSTEHLVNNGFTEFINYYDPTSWYPLGRDVGPTIFPGLMVTAHFIHKILNCVSLTVPIKDVCVFLAPLFSALTVLICYLMCEDIGLPGSGLFAGFIISVLPAYMSRSVAGSYDNEAIAIFAMVFTFFWWNRAIRSGSILYSTFTALAYFYMVSAWGGYVFIINLIPLHALIVLFYKGFDERLYVSYSTFYVTGTLLSMQIRFVGFQPVQSSEHLVALAVFGLLQFIGAYIYLKGLLGSAKLIFMVKRLFSAAVGFVAIVGVGMMAFGVISPWTGRFYSLLDPSYAKNKIPLIASVAEHQTTAWSSLYNDFFVSLFCFPTGVYFCIYHEDDTSKLSRIFLLVYVLCSLYFASLMVRLVLVLAPGIAILSGTGLSSFCYNAFKVEKSEKKSSFTSSNETGSSVHPRPSHSGKTSKMAAAHIAASMACPSVKQQKDRSRFRKATTLGLILLMFSLSRHCISVGDQYYSSPSIILSSRTRDGNLFIIDDFREAYWWLRQNTDNEARVMSWWDYGYQLASIANRTTLVDNNTWNNTHISRVGQAMVKQEHESYAIMRELDVDYVLILFGGLLGFTGDDISKAYWMIKIGASTPLGQDIDERKYFSVDGEFRIDQHAGAALKQSLLYKMCYYRFDQFQFDRSVLPGFDRARNQYVGVKDINFNYIEEVFSSTHWLVRIYRVKPDVHPSIIDSL